MKLREVSVILVLIDLDKNSVKVEVKVNVQVDIEPNLMAVVSPLISTTVISISSPIMIVSSRNRESTSNADSFHSC